MHLYLLLFNFHEKGYRKPKIKLLVGIRLNNPTDKILSRYLKKEKLMSNENLNFKDNQSIATS